MADFDWVAERANCSLEAVFRSLELGVKSDVDRRNAVALGRKGGKARAVTKTAEELTAIGKAGALARWGKKTSGKKKKGK